MKKPRLVLVALLVTLAVTLLSFGTMWTFQSKARTADEQATAISLALVRLERAIGYGGMIHHFKNAVLRPSEPEYLDRAAEAFQEARQATAALDALLRSSALNVDLSDFASTLDEYGDMIEIVRQARGQGLSIGAVDRLVRISDASASFELAALEDEIVRLLADRQRAVSASYIISFVVFASMVFALIVVTAYAVWLKRREGLLLAEQRERELAREQAVSQDLSRLIERLEQSNRNLDEFAYVASHDLKEPLRGITINAHFLLKEDLPGRVGERIERMSVLAKRMEDLVSDLLAFSRLGRIDQEQVPIVPAALIKSIRTDLKEWLAEHGGHIRQNGEIPSILADPMEAKAVFQNLIVNGIKYNDAARKEVEIGFYMSVELEGRVLRNAIYFKDNGIGIKKENQGKAFRIFGRLNSANAYGQGTGAGLAFVRRIVEEQGGVVEVQSVPGEGSVFYVTLPLAISSA